MKKKATRHALEKLRMIERMKARLKKREAAKNAEDLPGRNGSKDSDPRSR
jgi:hypothetical protein